MIVTQISKSSLIKKEKLLMSGRRSERKIRKIKNKGFTRNIYAIICKIKSLFHIFLLIFSSVSFISKIKGTENQKLKDKSCFMMEESFKILCKQHNTSSQTQ